jgi:molybdopterin molybdotransferase
MIPLEAAQELVVSSCPVLGTERRRPGDALGCVTAEAILATEDVPPFANSAMDGYALRAADVAGAPCSLEVVGAVMAGDGRRVVVGPGQAVRIMTGAPVPEGADAVCMVEETAPEDGGRRVRIKVAVGPGTSVRPQASDVAAGTAVVPARTVLSPAHLGVIARFGLEEVCVHRLPRVGVLSTGDELREGPTPLPTGAIRDANRPMLVALLGAAGYPTVDLGIVPDDTGALRVVLEEATNRFDAVVTSGGVSVGDLDVVRMVLDELCGEDAHWMQVAIRPAKPLGFGLLAGRVPVFGLPGNPVSSLVSFELFAAPALRRMAGHAHPVRPPLRAVTDVDLDRHPDGKIHFLRVRASVGQDGALHVRPSGGQESHQLRALADANALVALADGPGVAAGQEVDVHLLGAERVALGRL